MPRIFAQRWLRAVDRIPEALRRRETVFGWLTIVFGIIGSAGLITLGIMDDVNHGTVHWSMTVVFVVGIAISAVAQTCEVSCLATDHPDRAHLRRNGILKLIIVGLAVACAITFGGLQGSCQGDIHPADHPDRDCYNITSAAASFEWATAFMVVFYFLTLSLDLWPAAKTSPRFLRKMAKWEEDHLSKAESHLIADLHEPSNQPASNYFSDRSDYDHAYDTENAYPMRQHSPPSMEQPNHPYAGYT